jgi:hypothetical protein
MGDDIGGGIGGESSVGKGEGEGEGGRSSFTSGLVAVHPGAGRRGGSLLPAIARLSRRNIIREECAAA